MSEIIDGIETPIRITPEGMVDILCRAEKQADFETTMKKYALMLDSTDDDGNPIVIAAPGINLTPQPIPIVLEEATFDEDGNILTPAEISKRYHVNIRIAEPALTALHESGLLATWEELAKEWASKGTEETEKNKTEKAIKFDKVAFINPASVATQQNVWLGQ